MARRKYINGLKRHPSHYRIKSPMLHESFMNHEHPHKESEALDNVYGNVQMGSALQSDIKKYMSKPSTSKKETPATPEESEKKAEKGMVEKMMEKTGKKLISSKATTSKTTKSVVKNLSKFAKVANVAGLMLDPLSAGEGSTLYTYKKDPQTGLQTAYHNHGPNKGQKVEFNFPDS
jgi:leucyl aminopeptidase (aminopeptidase T)